MDLSRRIRWEPWTYGVSHSVLFMYAADPVTHEALGALQFKGVRRMELDSTFEANGVAWEPGGPYGIHRVEFQSQEPQVLHALCGFATQNIARLDHAAFMNGIANWQTGDTEWVRLFG